MSFFGLTMLGPQNSFKTDLINAIGLTMFKEEEYKAAFDRIDTDHSGYITVEEVRSFQNPQLKTLLESTYGFEPLEDEVERIILPSSPSNDGGV